MLPLGRGRASPGHGADHREEAGTLMPLDTHRASPWGPHTALLQAGPPSLPHPGLIGVCCQGTSVPTSCPWICTAGCRHLDPLGQGWRAQAWPAHPTRNPPSHQSCSKSKPDKTLSTRLRCPPCSGRGQRKHNSYGERRPDHASSRGDEGRSCGDYFCLPSRTWLSEPEIRFISLKKKNCFSPVFGFEN